MWQKLSKSYPPQFELLPLSLLLVSIYLAVSSYSSLPDRVPTHFNFWGVPDGWGDKSSILALLALNACVYVLLTVINVLLAIVRDPRKLINLPEKRKAALTDAQVEWLRIFLNRCLFVMKVLIQGFLLYTVYITIEIALGRAAGLGDYWFLFLMAIMALVFFMVWRSFRIASPGKAPPSLP
jgi:uncharacterized membrane protein